MAPLVRGSGLAPRMARRRERKVHRSPSQPLTGLMLSPTSYRGTARYSRTDKPVSGQTWPRVIRRSVAYGHTVHRTNYTKSEGQTAPCAAVPFLCRLKPNSLLGRFL